MLQNYQCNFHSKCQNTLWTLIYCPPRFVTLENAPKNWPKSFLHWQVCLFFFSKISFWPQQPLRCCRNDPKSSAAHSICQNTLWIRVMRSLRFVTLGNARRNRPKSFPHWKECIFFEKLCFQQPLRCYRIDLVTSTVIVRSPFGLLWIIYWGLPHSMNREKIQQKLFFTGRFCLFFSKIFVFNNFLGVTELIL